ncbi:MAG: NADH-quinone oxidoreductase subunit J [Phycisphaeraceae bacterium]|nr:NADH-quinone oxidoreductase subunit J [Phycisphaeraceae bacterium]
MDQIINPLALYAACGLGAIGVCLALPRKEGKNPQILGAMLASIAGAIVLIAMGLKAGGMLGFGNSPTVYFYVFALVALGASLRVVTHPRPVYAALYFVLSILATAGLFLILSAEFMAFALVIVYAGAILITYLFVIMLATQAPTEGLENALADYDTQAREPIIATAAGFVLLAVLTTLLFRGVDDLPSRKSPGGQALLAEMPRKIEAALTFSGGLASGDKVVVNEQGEASIDFGARTVKVRTAAGQEKAVTLPADLAVSNVEMVGFNLLRDHPGSIEIAGVILLMAMLGAVVLSRKQVQLDEDAKERHAKSLAAEVAQGVETNP